MIADLKPVWAKLAVRPCLKKKKKESKEQGA
jgi:hypothetical protein